MDEILKSEIKHLYEVEGLSMRQIGKKLKICRNRISRIIISEKIMSPTVTIMTEYERIISEWYKEYPFLKASQVYEKLKTYGYAGSYPTVCLYTQKHREKKKKAYHELEFLPGEEAQIDWMEERLPFGIAYGFVLILAYSRYVYVKFYPRYSMEFFLDGHIEAFKEINGVAHKNRYDNLRSVVIARKPELKLNPQIMDFARHYGFSIYPCNPYSPNEKGRVERVIRDIRNFTRINTFADLKNLNIKIDIWRKERNNRIHRSTGKLPQEALKEEKLKHLPAIHYRAGRIQIAVVSTTGFVEFDTNRYSVPSSYSGKACEIQAYPETVEFFIKDKKVAIHKREFLRKQKIEHPKHREKLLDMTPQFKNKRIYQLIKNMDYEFKKFINKAEGEGENGENIAYELFQILRTVSKSMLLSSIREANGLGVSKIKYLKSILQLPCAKNDNPIYPQDSKLLEITYERRELKDYDKLI